MGDTMNLLTLPDRLWPRTLMSTARARTLVLAGSHPCWRSRQIPILFMVIFSVWCELSLLQTEIARAEIRSPEASDNFGDTRAQADIRTARNAVAANPAAEEPVRNLLDALARSDRKREALVEADRFVKHGKATAALRAQRGYLRRALGDMAGAVEDFAEALKGTELSTDGRRNVEAGLAEALAAETQSELDRAQSDLARGDFIGAADKARLILESNPTAEFAMGIRIEALTAAGRKREALAEANQFVQRAPMNRLLRAQRGFLLRELNDAHGASEEFAAALVGDELTPDQRRNVKAGLAEARTAETQEVLDQAESALKRRDYKGALEASQGALERNSNSEAAMRIRIEALLRMGRPRDAATEGDRFIARNAASAVLRAQRGFLRRELHDIAGAIEDFTSALASDGLSVEQRRNVQAALAEARTADQQEDYDRAQTALARGDLKAASDIAAGVLQRDPNSQVAMRIRIDALSRAGRKREVQAEVNRLISRGRANGWVYAQRGFARRDADDLHGAVQDFDSALGRGDLDRKSVPNIRYARAVAAAMLAEREGNPQIAEASYREFLQR